MDLTFGGRYTEDEKTTNQSGQTPCGIEPFSVLSSAPPRLLPRTTTLCFGPGGLAAIRQQTRIGGDQIPGHRERTTGIEFTPRVGVKWA